MYKFTLVIFSGMRYCYIDHIHIDMAKDSTDVFCNCLLHVGREEDGIRISNNSARNNGGDY